MKPTLNKLIQFGVLTGALFSMATASLAQYGMVYFDGYHVVDGSRPPIGLWFATDFKVTLYHSSWPGDLQPGPTVQNDIISGGGTYWGNTAMPGDPISLPPYFIGQQVFLQVKAWSPSSYPTYEAAVASANPAVMTYVSSIDSYQLGWDWNNTPFGPGFDGFTLLPLVPFAGFA